MILKLIILLIFSSYYLSHARSPGSYYQLKNEAQAFSRKSLIDLMTGLVKVSTPSRMIGAQGHDKARDYIIESIKKLDSKNTGKLSLMTKAPDITSVKAFYQNDFNDKIESKILKSSPEYIKWLKFTLSMQSLAEKYKEVPVQNIVWEKSGINSDKVLIVTAHYDTISHDKLTLMVKENEAMPGANYNASGVSIALGLIKLLSSMDLNYSVKVVFLDWQGIGFHGSEIFATELKKSQLQVMGVINLEMLGQDTSYFDKTKKNGNMSVYLRNDQGEMILAKKLIDHGTKLTQKVTFEMKPNGFQNSDNFRFSDLGFSAVTFSQNWEDDFNPKFYQTPLDTPETLNHDTLYASYQYLAGSVCGILLDLTK